MRQPNNQPETEDMQEKIHPKKRYIFASDFDQTLSFNDSGYVLSELLGISTSEFERKTTGMAKLNLVQQGGELAYLLLHDPEFRSRVRREHLYEAGKRVRLKPNIDALYRFCRTRSRAFISISMSSPPGRWKSSARRWKASFRPTISYGTEFEYNTDGEIERIKQVTAGYGKVAVIDQLLEKLKTGPDRIVYVGDGSSDIHVMLHINRRDGFTIAVSENKYLAPIAKRSVISDSALAILMPILEEVVGWDSVCIRELFEEKGLLIQQWDKVQTDMLTIVPVSTMLEEQVRAAIAD